ALKYIKEYGRLEDIPQIQDQLEKIDYNQIRRIFLEPKVAEISEIKFNTPNYSEITNYLAGERDFSKDRIESSLSRLQKATQKRSHTLEQWFD
ncbi:MAG: flap structure-specific endonuclease, partial [Candidatus Nitrosotenuis sp.]